MTLGGRGPAAVAGLLLLMALVGLLGVGYRAWDGGIRTAERDRLQVESLQAAQRRATATARLADALQTRLSQAEDRIHAATKERDDAISRATTGRACLRGAAVRVLDGAPGLRTTASAAPSRGAARTRAAAAAHPGAAGQDAAQGSDVASADASAPGELTVTDDAAAHWMLQAGAMYEVCRAKFDELALYVERTGGSAVDERPLP